MVSVIGAHIAARPNAGRAGRAISERSRSSRRKSSSDAKQTRESAKDAELRDLRRELAEMKNNQVLQQELVELREKQAKREKTTLWRSSRSAVRRDPAAPIVAPAEPLRAPDVVEAPEGRGRLHDGVGGHAPLPQLAHRHNPDRIRPLAEDDHSGRELQPPQRQHPGLARPHESFALDFDSFTPTRFYLDAPSAPDLYSFSPTYVYPKAPSAPDFDSFMPIRVCACVQPAEFLAPAMAG